MRVQVPSDTPVREYEFNGKWYSQQEAAIFNGSHYPKPFYVSTAKGESYPKGEYILDPQSFSVNEKGKLILGSVKLLPSNGAGK